MHTNHAVTRQVSWAKNNYRKVDGWGSSTIVFSALEVCVSLNEYLPDEQVLLNLSARDREIAGSETSLCPWVSKHYLRRSQKNFFHCNKKCGCRAVPPPSRNPRCRRLFRSRLCFSRPPRDVRPCNEKILLKEISEDGLSELLHCFTPGQS